MKYIILLLLSQFAVARPQALICYQALGGKGKASLSTNWDVRLRGAIQEANSKCEVLDDGIACWRNLLKSLDKCDGAGEKSFQSYLEQVRGEIEAHFPKPNVKAKPGASG